MVTAAWRAPVAEGVNVTVTVQLPFGSSPPPQLLVSEKSAALVPVTVMCDSLMGTTPISAIVKVWAELVVPTFCVPKFSRLDETLTADPVAVRETICGLPSALSVMLS